MSYSINVSGGSPIVIATGTLDNSTSLSLVGKNYPNYGVIIDQNFVNLLQNFANNVKPTNSILGQIWYDTDATALKVYNGSTYKLISPISPGPNPPSNSLVGDQWWDTNNSQLRVYDGTSWVLIGPVYTASQNETGAFPYTISDGSNNHLTTAIKVGSTIVGIISKDATFTPASTIQGFPLIRTGFNVNQSLTQTGFYGNHYGNLVGNVTGNVSGSMYGNLYGNVNGNLNGNVYGSLSGASVTATHLYGSLTGDLTGPVNGNLNGSVVTATNLYGNLNGNLNGNVYGTVIGGVVGSVTLTSALTVNGFYPSGNSTVDIGSSSNQYFRNVYANVYYGTAVKAQYADLAEKYACDNDFWNIGEIVVFGGDAEITVSSKAYDTRIAGVISSSPAYTMNDTDETGMYPYVALTGRVPCKVKGPVKQGDCIVASDIAGTGQALDEKKWKPGCVVGKALGSIDDNSVQMIEVVVGRF